jgi:glycosyltransferase involved in cell wall biosynthesis
LIQGKFDKSVSLLCWAFNEEDSILEYLEKATELMSTTVEDYEIILIDDGSIDKTYEIASKYQKTNQNLKIYKNEKNLNVGISSRRAIQKATKEYLFWQTIDWCYDISNLREYLEYLKEFDIVQGVRRKAVKINFKIMKPFVFILKYFGIKYLTKRSDTIRKSIVSLINYLLIRVLFQVPISDYQNVSFYPTKWIQEIQYESKSSFANPEGIIKSYWNGMKIKEVQIDFIPRKFGKGVAKGTKLKSIITSVYDIFRLWFKWVILKKRNYYNKGKIERLF